MNCTRYIATAARSYRLRNFAASLMSATALSTIIVASAATSAHAQATADGSRVEDVVVTGTRIVRDGYEAPTPTTVVSADQFQQQASPNLIDFLNQVPAFSGNQTLQTGQGGLSDGAGISSLNLRDLGSNRTLILIDGQRTVASTTDGRVDVNAIPSQLIQRVDIVTGGASAAYGSDAVAGVVNFVLDTNFIGLKGEASGGITTYGDNASEKYALTAGTSFANGRGHFIVSGEDDHQDGILGDRPWNETNHGIITNPAYGTGHGQTTSVPELLVLDDIGPAYSKGGIIASGPLKGVAFGQGGQPYMFDYGSLVSGGVMQGGEAQAQQLRQTQGPPIEPQESRESFFTRTSYALNSAIEVYAQYNWFHSHYFGGAYGKEDPTGLNVPVTNAYLDPAIAKIAVADGLTVLPMGSSYADQGLIYQSTDNSLNRIVVGAKGDFDAIGTHWSWDGYYQLGVSKFVEKTINNRNQSNFDLALDSVRSPTTGAIVCRSTLTDPGNGCVAYDPFGINVNSPTQLGYIAADGYGSETFTQNVISASIQGEPFSTWAGSVSVATGAEHRNEAATGRVSALDQEQDLYDGNYLPTFGKYNVTEGFFETVVPLARAIPFAENLDLNAAIRATDYSTAGFVTTWKVGATWTPISDLTLRATRSRDIRAPNISELYNAGTSALGGLVDSTPGANFGNPVTYTKISRGNPDLAPERSDTTGIGAVFQPSFLQGFQASVDYWDIDVQGVIASISPQQILNLCNQGDKTLCAAINPGTVNAGQIFYGGAAGGNIIDAQPFNLASQTARGVDLEAGYTTPLSSISDDWDGSINLRALATYTIKNSSADGIGAAIESAGQNAAGGIPSWRWQASATYNLDPLTLVLTARGVSSGTLNNAYVQCQTSCPVATSANTTVNNNYISGAMYWDFATSYSVYSWAQDSNVDVFLNIRNILNKGAAPIAFAGNFQFDAVNTNPTLYDTDGRVYRVGVRFHM